MRKFRFLTFLFIGLVSLVALLFGTPTKGGAMPGATRFPWPTRFHFPTRFPFPVPAPRGNIAGTVFFDLNENGIQDPGEVGFGGVVLTLENGLGRFLTNTTTAPNGTYSFNGLAPGLYALVETVPSGWAATTPPFAADVGVYSNQTTVVNFGLGFIFIFTPTPTPAP